MAEASTASVPAVSSECAVRDGIQDLGNSRTDGDCVMKAGGPVGHACNLSTWEDEAGGLKMGYGMNSKASWARVRAHL